MHTDVLNECRRAVGCASPGMRRKAKWREAVLLLATGESRPNEWLLDNASHGRYSDYRFDEGVEERRAPGRGGGGFRSWSKLVAQRGLDEGAQWAENRAKLVRMLLRRRSGA